MSKRYLALLLIAVVALGVVGYWFFRQQQADSPSIAILPPAQALGFVAVPGLPQAWTDLHQSKFFQHISAPAFWQRALGQDGYQRVIEEKQHIEQRLGLPLTEQTVSLLLGREVGLALVPSRGQPWPVDVIVYIRVSGTEKIAETLARTFSTLTQDLVRETQMVDNVEIVTLRQKDATIRVSYAFLGTLAVLSTDPTWVIDAIKARPGVAAHDRLYTTAFFQAMQLEAAESLLAYGYYDVAGIQAQAMAKLPWAAHTPPAATLSMLQTTGKVTLKATRAHDGVKVETMALHASSSVSQVFREVDRDGAMPPFQGVPAETFYLTHVDLLDLQGLWQVLRQLAAMSSPDLLQQKLAQFRAWAGVDLERDVLPIFTGVGGLGIIAPLGPQRGNLMALPGVFLTLGVTDESKAQQLLQTIGTHAGGPMFSTFLQRLPHNGHTIYYLNNPLFFVKPGYMISRQQLILGSDVRLLQHMLDAATGKTKALSETNAYQALRKHFHIKGGSITFIDVTTAVGEAREAWLQLGGLVQALTHPDPGAPSMGSIPGDPWALLEILRPIHYIGVASQAEAQGVKTEAFVTFEDLK
jgi:hypothetical protein